MVAFWLDCKRDSCSPGEEWDAVGGDSEHPIKQEMAAIADMVCDFKVRTIGSDFETSMIVSKFRNAPENLSIMVYRVTPAEGITPETVERIA